ncbi:hypothetical protein FRC03_005503, partial [Tulasnella sp. 419]
MRPGSSASLRPSSSLSQNRPSSRVSARPSSRVSHRPSSRSASRLAPQIATLVSLITGIDPQTNPEDHAELCINASRNLETFKHSGETVDINMIQRRIQGFTEKARINGQTTLAEAYLETFHKLLDLVKANPSTYLDEPGTIKELLLPDHLHFILSLASPPSKDTLEAAGDILHNLHNPPESEKPLTWEDILAEEPLEGDHWEGYLVLDETVKPPLYRRRSLDSEIWSEDAPQTHSDASLSELSHGRSPSPESYGEQKATALQGQESSGEVLDELLSRQYWTDHWQPHANADKRFDLREPSTLGPAVHQILEPTRPKTEVIYMKEIDAVREVLMALQGITSCLFTIDPTTGQVEISPSAPRLTHMSTVTYTSLLSSFADTCSALHQIRVVVAWTKKRVSDDLGSSNMGIGALYDQSHSRTFEAFTEGVGSIISEFSQWCADREARISFSQSGQAKETIISLLSLEKSVASELASSHHVLKDILERLLRTQAHHPNQASPVYITKFDFTQISPACISTYLLDALSMNAQTRFAQGDIVTASALTRIFMDTMKPIWSNIGLWLKNGSSMEYLESPVGEGGVYRPAREVTMDEEFFIKRNWLGSLAPQFWDESFNIRTYGEGGVEVKAVPLILGDLVDEVLSAGKAVSLLRSLGMDDFFRDDDGYKWLGEWPDFDTVIGFNVESRSGSPSPSDLQEQPPPADGDTSFSTGIQDTSSSSLLPA